MTPTPPMFWKRILSIFFSFSGTLMKAHEVFSREKEEFQEECKLLKEENERLKRNKIELPHSWSLVTLPYPPRKFFNDFRTGHFFIRLLPIYETIHFSKSYFFELIFALQDIINVCTNTKVFVLCPKIYFLQKFKQKIHNFRTVRQQNFTNGVRRFVFEGGG